MAVDPTQPVTDPQPPAPPGDPQPPPPAPDPPVPPPAAPPAPGPAGDAEALGRQVEALMKRVNDRDEALRIEHAARVTAEDKLANVALSDAERKKADKVRQAATERSLKSGEAERVARYILGEAVTAVCEDEAIVVDVDQVHALADDVLFVMVDADEDVTTAYDAASGLVTAAVSEAAQVRLREKAKRVVTAASRPKGTAVPPTPKGTPPTVKPSDDLPLGANSWDAGQQPTKRQEGVAKLQAAAEENKDLLSVVGG